MTRRKISLEITFINIPEIISFSEYECEAKLHIFGEKEFQLQFIVIFWGFWMWWWNNLNEKMTIQVVKWKLKYFLMHTHERKIRRKEKAFGNTSNQTLSDYVNDICACSIWIWWCKLCTRKSKITHAWK